jgi:hypothetical protein
VKRSLAHRNADDAELSLITLGQLLAIGYDD